MTLKGMQHNRNVEEAKFRDLQKLDFCVETGSKIPRIFSYVAILGITVVEVPYWWDKRIESLQATIYKQSPDLFPVTPTGIPIPTKPLKVIK